MATIFCILPCSIAQHEEFSHVPLIPLCIQTQLARAIAGEARAAFISIGPSDVLSKFVGESEASVRSIFRKGTQRNLHVSPIPRAA
jgi:hypothetical protein